MVSQIFQAMLHILPEMSSSYDVFPDFEYIGSPLKAGYERMRKPQSPPAIQNGHEQAGSG